MPNPAIVRQTKKWPLWEPMRNVMDAEFQNHQWYKLHEQSANGEQSEKGKGKALPVVKEKEVSMEEEVEPDLPGPMPGPSEHGNNTGGRGHTQSWMVNSTSTCGRRKSRRRSKSVKSVASVNSNAEVSTPTSMAMDGPMAPPTGFVHAPDEDRCKRCKRAGRACPVKPGQACWYCNRGKAKCSLVSELRGWSQARSRARSRAQSPGHRHSALPESSMSEKPKTHYNAFFRHTCVMFLPYLVGFMITLHCND